MPATEINENKLEQLRTEELSLAGEVDSLRHELRRVNDGLERVGGASRGLEQQARQLASSISLCCEELGKNQQLQAQLTDKCHQSKG